MSISKPEKQITNINGLTVVEFDSRYPMFAIRNDGEENIFVSTSNPDCPIDSTEGVTMIPPNSAVTILNYGYIYNNKKLYINGNGSAMIIGCFSKGNFNVGGGGNGDKTGIITGDFIYNPLVKNDNFIDILIVGFPTVIG